jgi:hypothetical protein
MKNGMLIIDADGHAVDNEAVYRERLPEQYRRRSFIYPSDGFDRHQNGKIQKQPKTRSRTSPTMTARASTCRSSTRPAG